MSLSNLVDENAGVEPNNHHKHIAILEERLLYIVKKREQMLAQDPNADIWEIDRDIANKRKDLENALDYLRMQRIANRNKW